MTTVEIAESVDTVSDELVEAPLVVEEQKRRIGPLDIIGPLVVLAALRRRLVLHAPLGHASHLFDKPGFLMPPPHEILYDSFVRKVRQPNGGTFIARDGTAPGALADRRRWPVFGLCHLDRARHRCWRS